MNPIKIGDDMRKTGKDKNQAIITIGIDDSHVTGRAKLGRIQVQGTADDPVIGEALAMATRRASVVNAPSAATC